MVNNLTRVSEVTIAYRPKFKASTRPQVTTAEHAYQIFIHQWDKDTIELLEEFKIMLLNRHNKVLGVATISLGGLDKTVVDPKVVFAIALKAKASSIILAHNHPSGNLHSSGLAAHNKL
jgi:DNA repair protein RadC